MQLHSSCKRYTAAPPTSASAVLLVNNILLHNYYCEQLVGGAELQKYVRSVYRITSHRYQCSYKRSRKQDLEKNDFLAAINIIYLYYFSDY